MSSRSRVVGLLVLVLVGTGYTYFFTDVFISPSDKFLGEVKYYENMRLDVANYSINDLKWDMKAVWDVPQDDFEIIKVSKQELRDYIQTSEYSGADSNFVRSLFDFDSVPPDLSYDPVRLELWVGGVLDNNFVIYCWTP